MKILNNKGPKIDLVEIEIQNCSKVLNVFQYKLDGCVVQRTEFLRLHNALQI